MKIKIITLRSLLSAEKTERTHRSSQLRKSRVANPQISTLYIIFVGTWSLLFRLSEMWDS